MEARGRHHARGGGRRFQHGGGRGGGRGRGHGHHGHQASAGGRGSFWFKGEGYNDYEAVSIEEEVVGIRGFLSPDQKGFPGLVKHRYSDFVVHEIAANGQPVELTSLITKKRTIQANFTELVAAFAFGDADQSTGGGEGGAECLKVIRQLARTVAQNATARSKLAQDALETYNHRRLVQLVARELGDKMGGEFEDFLEKVKLRKQAQADARAAGISTENTAEDGDLQFFVAGLHEKSDRVFIHETMRRYGKSLIVADTITSPDQSQVIRIRPVSTGVPRKGERDPRRDWPVDRPDYLQFVVYKRNKEILAVLNQIAGVLKVNPSLFSYAETKDKRGITTQHCTAYRIPKERFQTFVRLSARNLDDQGYVVGNLKYVPKKLSVGDCLGNAFSIVLRALPDEGQLPMHELKETVKQWQLKGFINFFGIQRFGNSSTPNHVLGRAMLRKDFKMAVLLLLRPQEGEASKIRQAREHFRQHKDVAAALRMLPPFLIPERAVLEGLLQHGLDANELAFRSIPAHLRLSYVESYQHYVWNQMASMRVEKLSQREAVVGDLVFAKDSRVGSAESESSRFSVITLTEENVRNYTIADVVLPLPGYQITYPSNEIGNAYQKLLAMDGVDLASWEAATQSANHHPYDLRGSYRHLVMKPEQVVFEVQTYSDITQPLLLNDVDKLQGRMLPLDHRSDSQHVERLSATPPADSPPDRMSQTQTLEKEKAQTPGRALLLHFRLAYGSDATIAVRELMKQSSSMHVQMQLNDGKEVDGEQLQSKNGLGAKGGNTTGKKRPNTTPLAGNKSKEIKVVAPKKAHVAIGRPGFSLGK